MTVPLPEGLASLCNAPESEVATAAVKLLEAVAAHDATLAEELGVAKCLEVAAARAAPQQQEAGGGEPFFFGARSDRHECE